jgi:hypothetical protein
MKCLGIAQAIVIWIVIILAVWLFVPTNLEFIRQNTGWVTGLLLAGWWLYGYIGDCTKGGQVDVLYV